MATLPIGGPVELYCVLPYLALHTTSESIALAHTRIVQVKQKRNV